VARLATESRRLESDRGLVRRAMKVLTGADGCVRPREAR